jgi:hypothetical protein
MSHSPVVLGRSSVTATPLAPRVFKQMAIETCGKCGGKGVRIVYGLPGPALVDAAERGELALGGCVIGDDDPNLQCRACGNVWRTGSASGMHR